MTSIEISVFESENSRENMKIMNRIMSRKIVTNENSLNPSVNSRQILNGQILRPVSGHPIKKSQSLTPTNSSRFVLNGNTNFSSLRIEDPKKVEDTNDNDVKLMVSTIPEISRHFMVCGKLGEGTFSKVFRAKHLHNSSKEYALKYVIPTIKPNRIAAEIRYLRDLGGTKNIIGINTCFFSGGHTVLVMPIFPHQKFTDYVNQLTVDEVKHYMKNLLIALERVHSFGVIHRDIKPANFLYDRRNRRYALVDFGLAQNERELLFKTHTNSAFRRIHSNREKSSDKFKVPEKLEIINKPNKRLALIDCTISSNNNSLVKMENKWQIRKRSRNEAKINDRNRIAPKRARLEISPTKDSSVFNSPVTPTVFKSPKSPQPIISGGLATPVKCGVSLIPETPPKSIMKNLSKDLNVEKDMIPKEVNETPKSRYKSIQKKSKTIENKTSNMKCECIQTNQVCSVCKSKPELIAPRAGTPGFRAPEVLLKYLLQTTLIDIWSSGVIFASLLSGRYPFFRNTDDMTSLAEIITVLGSKRVKKAAKDLNKSLIISNNYSPIRLKEVCERLRDNPTFKAPDSAFDLLDKLLDPSPKYRWTASKALTHPFFTEDNI